MQTTSLNQSQLSLLERLGYACINLTLSKKSILTSRTCRLDTWKSKGNEHISKLTFDNFVDLERIIKWNIQNGIHFYRISSGLVPWMSEIKIEELKHFRAIQTIAKRIGDTARQHQLRLEFHPGHFCSLSSPNPKVVDTAIRELENHSLIFDLMDYPASPETNINIHVGTSKPNHKDALDHWINNWKRLSENCRKRIVVENDDKGNLYSIKDLYYLYEEQGIPITFDIFHHSFCTGGLNAESAQKLAAKTWGQYVPVMHFSSSKILYEDQTVKETSHADWIWDPITDHNTNSWIMCEAKQKELAILKYRNENV
jgi:UV DNA damage endonuclease